MSLEEFRENIIRTIKKNLSETDEGVTLIIRVETGFDENCLAIDGDELIFKTKETSESKHNAALVGFLSRELKIPSSRIDIIYGSRSRIKRVLIKDINAEDLEERLLRVIRLV